MTATEKTQNLDKENTTEITGETDDQCENAEPERDPNIILTCILKDDIERFIQCFEDEEDPYKELVPDLLLKKNDEGKSVLDMAAIFGRHAILKELLKRGVEVNDSTGKGYRALHHAASWGRVDCLKALIEGGADLKLKTNHEESAKDIALRYSHAECVDYLDWADAKQQLADYVLGMQETMADPEKMQGRIDRAEKNSTLALIKEKLEWLESATEATTQDFISHKLQMEETLQPIILKLNEPLYSDNEEYAPEKAEKK